MLVWHGIGGKKRRRKSESCLRSFQDSSKFSRRERGKEQHCYTSGSQKLVKHKELVERHLHTLPSQTANFSYFRHYSEIVNSEIIWNYSEIANLAIFQNYSEIVTLEIFKHYSEIVLRITFDAGFQLLCQHIEPLFNLHQHKRYFLFSLSSYYITTHSHLKTKWLLA